MADVHSREVRSYNMRQVKSKNSKPEIIVRRFLYSQGFRYRLHRKDLPGKPDIVLKKYNTIIFVNGCFWHGHHSCPKALIPKTRTDWWLKKITSNKVNDGKVISMLQLIGWEVIQLWQCEINEVRLKRLIDQLVQNQNK